MKPQWLAAVAALGAGLAGMTVVQAADTWPVGTSALERGDPVDLAMSAPVERVMQFGTQTGAMKVGPETLGFDSNRLNKLVIINPSDVTHYISAPDFAATVQTKELKVEGGQVTRSSYRWRHDTRPPAAKRFVQEIELRPGGKLEWLFVAQQAGDYRVACTLQEHAKAGMIGTIKISG